MKEFTGGQVVLVVVAKTIPLLVTDNYNPSTVLSFTSSPCMITMVYHLPSYSKQMYLKLAACSCIQLALAQTDFLLL